MAIRQDKPPFTNRLIDQKSPYLLQHAHNPVDWYPWGPEAFDRAKKEDKPIFLSLGYSTCHWCHVMERESFENEEIARFLNDHFIAVKVDREERPDLDELYLAATQLVTGRGGWPNSVWLTHDGRPWFAGTYFPPEDRLGVPGLRRVLSQLNDLWRTRREDVQTQANSLAQAIRQFSTGSAGTPTGELSRQIVTRAIDQLSRAADMRYGGFGGAPKFPPHSDLRLLTYEYARTKDPALREIIIRTLDGLAQGGIHDQVGGGFHRYSTDERWFLPHFEKMLYDNAQLARSYLDGYQITGDPDYRRMAEGIFGWAMRDMLDKDGAFHCALDADSEAVEGKFYLWSRPEILEVLGEKEGELFCRAYGVEKAGNYREESTGQPSQGLNILYLPRSIDMTAKVEGFSPNELHARLAEDRDRLLDRRNRRPWPQKDDKVLTSWNGLMIASLAYAGQQLPDPRYTRTAIQAAEFLLGVMRKDGRLLRSYRDGQAGTPAYLEDYACLADGLLELHEATGDNRWLEESQRLMDVLIEHYHDRSAGGFFFTADDQEELLARSKDPFDKAIPSGNGMAGRVLLRLAKLTGQARYMSLARGTLEAFLSYMDRAPQGTQTLILDTAMYFDQASNAPQIHSEAPDAISRENPVTLEAFISRTKVAPGRAFELAVRLTVDQGYHVNSSSPLQNYLIPTRLLLRPSPAAQPGEVTYPQGKQILLPFLDEPLSIYDGAVWMTIPVTVPVDAKPGHIDLLLDVHLQPCSNQQCLPPQKQTLTIPLEIAINPGEASTQHREVFHKR